MENDKEVIPDESGIFPLPLDESIPVHSTPVKPTIPPFSTKKRAHGKKTVSVLPQGSNLQLHHHHSFNKEQEAYINQNNSMTGPHTPPKNLYHPPQPVQTPHKLQSSINRSRHDYQSPVRILPMETPNHLSGVVVDDTSTIKRQRQEVQLLVAELKDRDRELNEMMAAHQHQLLAWEQDRQRLLLLEQKYAKVHSEMQQKSRQLKNALSQLRSMRNESHSHSSTLESTQGLLTKLTEESSHHMTMIKELEDKTKHLNGTKREMSTTIGQLQAKELELTTMLQLKEKDLSTAVAQVRELTDRVKKLELRTKECQENETEAVRQANQWKHRHSESKVQLDNATDLLKTKDKELQDCIEKINLLQQKLNITQEEFDEREKCKNEIIESLKAKQARSDYQLRQIREMYERQHRELSLLHLNLDTSKEIIAKQQNSLEDYNTSRDSAASKSLSPARTADTTTDQHRLPLSRPQTNKQNEYPPSDEQCSIEIPLSKGLREALLLNQRETQNHQNRENSLTESGMSHDTRDLSQNIRDSQKTSHVKSHTPEKSDILSHNKNNDEDSLFATPPLQGSSLREQKNEAKTDTRVDKQHDGSKGSKDMALEGPITRSFKEHRVSFEDRLSTFLDDEQDVEDVIERGNVSTEASPGRKLQRLLVESKKMIENLEKSAHSVSLFKEDHEREQNSGSSC